MRDLFRRGWRPPSKPKLLPHQADRLLDDMARLTNDHRGAQPRNESLNLTPHERRILGMVARGLTAPEIAGELQRAPGTIKDQEKKIRHKLGARSNAHAVAVALTEGILDYGRAA
jgi:DNA-binding NarL/FixJ family response regulator